MPVFPMRITISSRPLHSSTDEHEAAIAIKNGEMGNGSWRYGEPVLGLNADLEPVWGPKAVPGGGHHILSLDMRWRAGVSNRILCRGCGRADFVDDGCR